MNTILSRYYAGVKYVFKNKYTSDLAQIYLNHVFFRSLTKMILSMPY